MKKTFFFAQLFCFTLAAALVRENVTYKSDGQEFEGYLVYDDGLKENVPGVLVVHDWLGLTDKTKAKADAVAELGYVAFAVDIYGKTQRPTGNKDAGPVAGIYKKDRKLFRSRLEAGRKAFTSLKLKVDKSKLAAIGYCFGGTGVVELARTGAPLKAVVSFHGSLDSPEPALGKKIKARVLALHGADDPFVAATDLQAFEAEMRDSKVDWQLIKYGGAVHSFTDKTAGSDNSKGAAYNAKADARSWESMKYFLNESFRF
jgi:dienelactone hydrolase